MPCSKIEQLEIEEKLKAVVISLARATHSATYPRGSTYDVVSFKDNDFCKTTRYRAMLIVYPEHANNHPPLGAAASGEWEVVEETETMPTVEMAYDELVEKVRADLKDMRDQTMEAYYASQYRYPSSGLELSRKQFFKLEFSKQKPTSHAE